MAKKKSSTKARTKKASSRSGADAVSQVASGESSRQYEGKDKEKEEVFEVLQDKTIFDGQQFNKGDPIKMQPNVADSHRERGVSLRGPLTKEEARQVNDAFNERKKAAASREPR